MYGKNILHTFVLTKLLNYIVKKKKTYKKETIEIICKECGKKFNGLTGRKFCCLECANKFFKKERIENFLKGKYINDGNIKLPKILREYLYEKNNYKCEICGYEGYNIKTNKTILQIENTHLLLELKMRKLILQMVIQKIIRMKIYK